MRERHEIRLWAVLFWIAVWQLASMRLDSDILLVSPFRVLCRLGELALTAAFWRAACFTLSRIASGFFLAAASGVLLAAVATITTECKSWQQWRPVIAGSGNFWRLSCWQPDPCRSRRLSYSH